MTTQTIALIKNLKVNRLDTAFSNTIVGRVTFTMITDSLGAVTIKGSSSGGVSQIISVPDVVNAIDAPFTLTFSALGFSIDGQTTVNYTCPLFNSKNKRDTVIAQSICNASTDLRIRSAITVDVTIPFGTNTLHGKATADLSLGDYQGWVLYRDPTQDELGADALQPNNMWQPYYGDWNEIPQLSANMLTRIKADKTSALLFSDGTTVPKFDYIWGDYGIIKDAILQKKYDGTASSAIFTFVDETAVSTARLNVYLNGIFQQVSSVTIDKNAVDCAGLKPVIGDTITVIFKAYAPSKAELAFDPDANPKQDNPIQNTQYKYDYQYTVREIRDNSGTLVNTLYYFWVANKNITTLGRSMSVQSAKSLLKVNTNPYAILQNIDATNGLPNYNQFIGVGLNRYINQDNTYKIRFTKDFILRDDPYNTQLKNVHTEWVLVREHQNSKIPEQLWNILVDSACGINIIGDPVPSLARIAYDERNGTNTRYGFELGQSFVAQDLALKSIKYAISNTSLMVISPANNGQEVPDPIEFIDPNDIDMLFSSPASTRKTLNDIWTKAKPKQINEIFFTVLYDALAENYEFTDIFKTSMIAAHSIRLFSSYGLGQ